MRYEVEWLSRVMMQGYAQSPLPSRKKALTRWQQRDRTGAFRLARESACASPGEGP